MERCNAIEVYGVKDHWDRHEWLHPWFYNEGKIRSQEEQRRWAFTDLQVHKVAIQLHYPALLQKQQRKDAARVRRANRAEGLSIPRHKPQFIRKAKQEQMLLWYLALTQRNAEAVRARKPRPFTRYERGFLNFYRTMRKQKRKVRWTEKQYLLMAEITARHIGPELVRRKKATCEREPGDESI